MNDPTRSGPKPFVARSADPFPFREDGVDRWPRRADTAARAPGDAEPEPALRVRPPFAAADWRTAAERLHRSAERAWDLVDRAREVLFTLAPQGAFTYLGRRFEESTGWSRGEWIAAPFASMVLECDRPTAERLVARARRDVGAFSARLRVAARSGESRTWDVTVSPRLVNGELYEIIGTAFDAAGLPQAGATSRSAGQEDS